MSTECPTTFAAVVAGDRAIRGGSSQSLPVAAAATVPLPDRCAYVDIPELALKNKPKIRATEVWDEFCREFSPPEQYFSCIQLVRQNRLRIWCTTSKVLEDICSTGLTLRGHPVSIRPIQDRSWLTVTHLPYGLPTEVIAEFFSHYGEVKEVRPVLFRNVHTGTIKVKVQLHSTVPTCVRICGHAGLVYHQGQTHTCYNCNKDGHEAKKCPKKQQPKQKKSKHPQRTEGPRPSSSSTTETAPPLPPSDVPSPSHLQDDEIPEPAAKRVILDDTTPASEGTSTVTQTTLSASTTEMVVDSPALPVDLPQDPGANMEPPASGDTPKMVVDPPTSSTAPTAHKEPSATVPSASSQNRTAPETKSRPFADAVACLRKKMNPAPLPTTDYVKALVVGTTEDGEYILGGPSVSYIVERIRRQYKTVHHVVVEEVIANLNCKDSQGNTIMEFPYEVQQHSG